MVLKPNNTIEEYKLQDMPRLNVNTKRGALGKRGEDIAADYLVQNGFVILDRNFECKCGEIDIIAVNRDRNLLCFVEVKCRRSRSYGLPAQSVVNKKQRHIRNSALVFLLGREKTLINTGLIDTDTDYRFDVVSLLIMNGICTLEHIEGAFE